MGVGPRRGRRLRSPFGLERLLAQGEAPLMELRIPGLDGTEGELLKRSPFAQIGHAWTGQLC